VQDGKGGHGEKGKSPACTRAREKRVWGGGVECVDEGGDVLNKGKKLIGEVLGVATRIKRKKNGKTINKRTST